MADPSPSPRALYHLRRVASLQRQLARCPDANGSEGLALLSRITHHTKKAKELAHG